MIKMAATIAIVSLALSFSGCRHTETFEDGSFIRPSAKTQFNDERYVWEQFIFTTNRVNEVR